jgi:hypothetical protein
VSDEPSGDDPAQSPAPHTSPADGLPRRAARALAAIARGPADGRHRTVSKTFRISAVWQPPPAATQGEQAAEQHEAIRAAGMRLSDEEVVFGLITERQGFSVRTLAVAQGAGATSVELEEVRPVGGVAAQIAFGVRVRGNAVAVVAGLAPAVMAGAAEALERAYGQPVAVSAVPEPVGGAVDMTPAASKSGWDRVAPVLAAIGTGIGVIGFVTFIGGVTVYARLRATGFPAAPALGIFPSQDLVVIGAQTLVPEALSALGAVILLSLVYTPLRLGIKRVGDEEAALLAGHATWWASFGMFGFVVLALAGSAFPFRHELDDHRLAAALLVASAALLAAAVVTVTRRFIYLATTTFVLVGVFLSFTAFWRESHMTGVRGAAIIRENKKAVAGLFVAEGSGRVYLARVNLADEDACRSAEGSDPGCAIDDNRSRLVGIAKDQVSDIALGDPKPPWLALQQARHLERELCNLQVERPAEGC